jgi:hypothetical protein
MTATSAFAALAPGLLILLLSADAQEQQEKPAENPEKRLSLSKKNAAAEELESLILALGLDAHRGDPSAEHPSREDLEAYQRAGLGSWLDAQLRTADDSIASVPASIRSFLEKRQPTLWRVVGLLERDVPRWESDPRAVPRDLSGALLAASLAKILLAAALVEEHAGHHAQAGDLLEATWSLSRSFSEPPDLTSQLIAVAMGKLQAGALRKMSEPPVQWLDRMSGVEPWRGMLDALDAEPHLSEAYVRAWRAVTDRLRKLSPCEVSRLSSEEIWEPAQEELKRSKGAEDNASQEIILAIATPNLTGAIRRAGRLLVDRELTSKILEIRQEKVASREGRWPEKFSNLDSRVCPGSSYEYQTRGAAMAVRFKGPIDDGGSPPFGAAALLRGPGSPPDADTPRATPYGHSSAPPLTPGFLPA